MDADANAGAMPPPAPRGRAAEEEPDQDEEPEEEQEENTGQWSPRALEPVHVPLGQDVIPEEEDARLLELLRAQVRRWAPFLARRRLLENAPWCTVVGVQHPRLDVLLVGCLFPTAPSLWFPVDDCSKQLWLACLLGYYLSLSLAPQMLGVCIHARVLYRVFAEVDVSLLHPPESQARVSNHAVDCARSRFICRVSKEALHCPMETRAQRSAAPRR